MKNLLLFFALSTTILFTSCEGDPGPPGRDGLDGINILGKVFEVTTNFQYDNPSNTFSTPFFSYPFDVWESDVVLTYRYEGQTTLGNGQKADVWTQLPQSIFYQDGTGDIFQYNFNHTFVDVQFTIEGNFDLTTIGNDYVANQIFRIAVVPAEYGKINPSMEELLQMMQMDDSQIEKIEL
ncbi:MAG: collagen-like protein [Aequorivita sp.]